MEADGWKIEDAIEYSVKNKLINRMITAVQIKIDCFLGILC